MKGIFVLTKKLPFNYSALTLFPFVLFTGEMPEWLKNHERIHLRQQLEMLVLPFYLWYLIEFSIRFLKTGNRQNAYRSISFEREAYENHENTDYLSKRKPWAFLRYMKKSGI